METLTQINATETARRERARDYEIWTNEEANLKRQIAKLSVAPNTKAMKTLQAIIDLANTLPSDVIGSIGGLVAVEGIARGFLVALASSAVNNLNNMDERRRTALARAEKALAKAQAHLATFTE